ncbi:MAG TPA: hypothetical protein VFZ78_00250 [Flavisolibacter sp.]
MRQQNNRDRNNNNHNITPIRRERDSSVPNDLPDNAGDRQKLQPEETTISLPDVKDIPGQEFVHPPSMGELADTTISSDDEEGRRIFDRDDTEDLTRPTDSDVRSDEKETLQQADNLPTRDEDQLIQASLDNSDFEGERLNEGSFGEGRSGSDLDIPGAELDDRGEQAGAEDEENNSYSQGNPDNDNISDRTS